MRTILAAALLAACSGGGGESGPTAAEFEAAATEVHPMQPWAEAETMLKGRFGEPMSTDGDAWVWQTGGDPCTQLTVAKMGGVVGTASVEPCP